MSDKRLFSVVNTRDKKAIGFNFLNKQDAKHKRDQFNGGLSDEDGKHWNKDKGWRVTYGPDHWKYAA